MSTPQTICEPLQPNVTFQSDNSWPVLMILFVRGASALDYALHVGHDDIAQILRQHGVR